MPKRIPGEDQEPLFSGDFETGDQMMPWQERETNMQLAAHREAVAAGVPMINLLDRARRIHMALDEMSDMSSVGFGFRTATHTPHRRQIDDYYGSNVTTIVEKNAIKKLPRREERVKRLLGPATGYAALRAVAPNPELRVMPWDEINARAMHTWMRFITRFQGPDNLKRRTDYRLLLAKQIEAQEQLHRQFGVSTETNSDEKVA